VSLVRLTGSLSQVLDSALLFPQAQFQLLFAIDLKAETLLKGLVVFDAIGMAAAAFGFWSPFGLCFGSPRSSARDCHDNLAGHAAHLAGLGAGWILSRTRRS